MKNRLVHVLSSMLGIALFICAIFVLRAEMREHTLREVMQSLLATPLSVLVAALGLVLLSYFIYSLYDTLAFSFLGHKVPYLTVAVASFVGYALSSSIGLSTVMNGSVRYRFYSTRGLSLKEILYVVAFGSVTFWLGFCITAAVTCLLFPPAVPAPFSLPLYSIQSLGFLFIALIGAYLLWSGTHRSKSINMCGHPIRIPPLRISLMQMTIAAMEWPCLAAILYVLLPHIPSLSFTTFLGLFLLAQVLGIASQVPGGLGVFESIILGFYPAEFTAQILASLFVYRIIFNILPLTVATLVLGLREATYRHRHPCQSLPASPPHPLP